MSLALRKLLVGTAILAVIVVANVSAITDWLADAGLIGWVRAICSEYLTGTAVVVIVAMLVLLVEPSAACLQPWRWINGCCVCGHLRVRRGCYCAMCGSRV